MAFDKPAPDVHKLLAAWQEWERGETTPGQVLANLKRAGLPELLQHWIDEQSAVPAER
jgi:hypothetical protein